MIRHCNYCGQRYETPEVEDWTNSRGYRPTRTKPQSLTCSKPCHNRLQSWRHWEDKTLDLLIHGDVNKPYPEIPALPLAGPNMAKAIDHCTLSLVTA
jgi:hypothetical protein